jgi:hypothetical protein
VGLDGPNLLFAKLKEFWQPTDALSQQNQQLDLASGCNAFIPRDFIVRRSCSIPTAPTNHLFGWQAFRKIALGQKGADSADVPVRGLDFSGAR